MGTLIITVDGPSGTGKSTVSRAVAARLAIPHLDTGAFYRAATLGAVRAGIDTSDEESVRGALGTVVLDQEAGRMYLDGVDVSSEIREPDVTARVSQVAAHTEVRELLVEYQRDWVRRHGGRAVVEGRDIGTVVFPDADLKIYLDATPEVRARRRAVQDDAEPSAVLEDLHRRDHLDSTRETSPLKIPAGAYVIDTSDLTFDEVVDRVVDLVMAADSSI
jgi:cytidylate kinase